MLISTEIGIVNTNGFDCLNRNGYKYYYSGIIWMRGIKAGKETIQRISEIYEDSSVIPFNDIYGSFYCIIQHPDGKLILFTDNSHMRSFYIGKRFFGTDFLEMIKESEATEFNKDALCEFLAIGGFYFGKTLMSGIELSDTNKYYIYEKGEIQAKEKGISGIDGATSITDVNFFFEEMAYALSDMNITLSLTGGYDSRMVFASLKKYLSMDLFISGDNMKEKDIVISERVAKAAGCDIDLIKIQNVEVSDQFIQSLFGFAQGLAPFLNDGFIRISEFLKDREEKGFNCYLTGDGGDFHKDWMWTQDLPFYRKKSFNFNRFYSQRFHVIKEKIPWGNALEEKSQLLRQNMITEFKKFKMPLNTQTYDSLFFNVRCRYTSINYSIFSNVIWTYAPLMERELIRYSYHLPRSSRFFYNSMRKITTEASNDIARIPTVYGTTASNEKLYIIRDIFFQGFVYFQKACRMFGRKIFNMHLFVRKPITWTIEDEVRALTISKEALEYCINKVFIKSGTQLEDLSFPLLGRLIQIYILAQYLGIQEK